MPLTEGSEECLGEKEPGLWAKDFACQPLGAAALTLVLICSFFHHEAPHWTVINSEKYVAHSSGKSRIKALSDLVSGKGFKMGPVLSPHTVEGGGQGCSH